MKIEKLTENKIRIVLNLEDLETNNIDFESVLNNTPETQTLILSILNQAEKDFGFYTRDCKILIEAFASMEGDFVFTITKMPSNKQKNHSFSHKKSKVTPRYNSHTLVYSFKNFEEFCNFCQALHIELLSHKNLSLICKNTALYFYKNDYYLIIPTVNVNSNNINAFSSIA